MAQAAVAIIKVHYKDITKSPSINDIFDFLDDNNVLWDEIPHYYDDYHEGYMIYRIKYQSYQDALDTKQKLTGKQITLH